MDLREEIRDRIAEMLEIESKELGYDDLFTDHDVDSFMEMQIFAALESEYDISIPDERMNELISVNEAVRVIEELRK